MAIGIPADVVTYSSSGSKPWGSAGTYDAAISGVQWASGGMVSAGKSKTFFATMTVKPSLCARRSSLSPTYSPRMHACMGDAHPRHPTPKSPFSFTCSPNTRRRGQVGEGAQILSLYATAALTLADGTTCVVDAPDSLVRAKGYEHAVPEAKLPMPNQYFYQSRLVAPTSGVGEECVPSLFVWFGLVSKTPTMMMMFHMVGAASDSSFCTHNNTWAGIGGAGSSSPPRASKLCTSASRGVRSPKSLCVCTNE